MGRARVDVSPAAPRWSKGLSWPTWASRFPAKATVGVIILLGTLLRLALAPFGRYVTDNMVLAFRSSRLAALPLRTLYATNQGVIDHLPGDLWFLWYLSNVYNALDPDPDFRSHAFLILTKCVPILADAAGAFALFLLARDLAGPRAGIVAGALWAFNPGPIFVASIWDQWDSISTTALLFSVWFFLRRRYALSAALLTYAAIIKPQYSALGLLFALAFIRWQIIPAIRSARETGGGQSLARALAWPFARVIGAVATALATAAAVLVPFGVGYWPLPTQFDLYERLHFVYLIHDETSENAFTLWATPLVGNGVNDWQFHFLGLDMGTYGRIFLAIGLLTVLWLWWRAGTEHAFAWACLAMTYCLFMLPTRIHERYMFPVVAFAALAAALQPRRFWFFLSVTAIYAINVISVFWYAHAKTGAPFFNRHNPWVMLISTINVGLFLWAMARGLPGADEAEPAPWQFPWRKAAPVPATRRDRRGPEPMPAGTRRAR